MPFKDYASRFVARPLRRLLDIWAVEGPDYVEALGQILIFGRSDEFTPMERKLGLNQLKDRKVHRGSLVVSDQQSHAGNLRITGDLVITQEASLNVGNLIVEGAVSLDNASLRARGFVSIGKHLQAGSSILIIEPSKRNTGAELSVGTDTSFAIRRDSKAQHRLSLSNSYLKADRVNLIAGDAMIKNRSQVSATELLFDAEVECHGQLSRIDAKAICAGGLVYAYHGGAVRADNIYSPMGVHNFRGDVSGWVHKDLREVARVALENRKLLRPSKTSQGPT
jgi:hypothetical protein